MCLRIIFIFFIGPFSLFSSSYYELPEEHRQIMEKNVYKVLGVGGACLVDLHIPVSEEFLATVPGRKGGAEEVDFTTLMQIINSCGYQPTITTGGSCTNTIKGLASLGISCALVGKIGKGEWGEFFVNVIEKLKIVPLLTQGSASSACVLCLVTPDAQRTMRFFQGCSREMTPFYLHPEYVKCAQWVHVEGYAQRNPGLVKRTLELAKEANVPVSFDLSSFEITEEFRDSIHEYIEKGYIHLLFANEDETRALTGLEPLAGCHYLQKYCSVAVMLMGEKGALVGYQGNIFESPAIATEVVDTTGAGDLFASGFLYGYLQGYSLSQCAYMGNLLGGSVVNVVGAEIPEERWQVLREKIRLLDAN